jgi:2-polyprenyl-3-methyl-5-hydroxy-6-metoxy-1,4-benzoquinol methylase
MNIEKRDFDKVAASWDEEPRRVKLAADVGDAIAKGIPLNSRMDVLDFGCGTGLLTLRLRSLVRSITGVDSSKAMLDVLKAKMGKQNLANIRTQYLDLDKGDVLTGSYHLIVSSMTLHHIKEVKSLLDQFYKVAAPSGYLCIADLDLDDGQFHDNQDGVFHLGFDRAMLRRAFREAGFDDIRDRTAAEVLKSVSHGGMRLFSVFLMIGRKRFFGSGSG